MASDVELKKIKKKYGEKFMHMCRELFSTILEQEGALFAILEKTFANNSRTLYEDIHNEALEEEFKDFIYKIFDDKTSEEQETEKTPYELLDEAGYTLYECKTEKEIQEFKKYYREDEELCTFNGGRLKRCVVFFAVRKNVDEIGREDFISPKRQDKYGTSVMSIQFSKEGICTVSIKNRYNHTVDNPDATYGNDLDRIIPGLSQSFKKLLRERGLEFRESNIEELEIPGYIVADDGKYYKYNCQIDMRFYCPGNIIIDAGNVIKIGSPEKKILIDNFVLDLEKKCIKPYDKKFKIRFLHKTASDSFADYFEIDIEKIEITRDRKSNNRVKIIKIKKRNSEAKIEIQIDENNRIIGYINEELESVGDYFLMFNGYLSFLNLPNLKKCGMDFLYNNRKLNHLELPSLEEVGDRFLVGNFFGLRSLDLPCLKRAENYFLGNNRTITQVNLPNLEEVGDDFLFNVIALEELELPNLTKVGKYFLHNDKNLKKLKVNSTEVLLEINQARSAKGLNEVLTPEMFAMLDKDNEITNVEVKFVQRLVTRLMGFFRHRR